MRLVAVHGGHFAQVDDEDYAEISAHRWHIARGHNTVYAATNIKREGGGYSSVGMHRMINKTPPGLHTDHIDGNGMNNTRSNLRTATRTQNARNRSPNKGCVSPEKGVHWRKNRNNWVASIRVNKVLVYLGQFQSETEAAGAYRNAAIKYFGDFARTEDAKS